MAGRKVMNLYRTLYSIFFIATPRCRLAKESFCKTNGKKFYRYYSREKCLDETIMEGQKFCSIFQLYPKFHVPNKLNPTRKTRSVFSSVQHTYYKDNFQKNKK